MYRRVLYCIFALLLARAASGLDQLAPGKFATYSIRANSLVDALDRFGEQSGMQIVYDADVLKRRAPVTLNGEFAPNVALDHLLLGTGLVWEVVNPQTVAVHLPLANRPEQTPEPAEEVIDPTESAFSVIQVTEDPLRALPNEASESAFGFNKSILETPRSVSFISQETIDLFALTAVEDLVRVAPGVFTTTRFGIQGAVDVRNVPADTYFRGMKRLSLQGHGRSVLAAMDTIEVVGGPPSPLYGMGKIGGYTNMVPKSGRARTGTYLTQMQGFAQYAMGDYSRNEVSFGVGGPMEIAHRFDRDGGYYVYGLLEDSDSYASGVPVKQQVLQAATTIDNAIGPFRLETGINYQLSQTAGALTGRFTQDVVDTRRYIRGTPLINLDANGNGAIGYYEMQRGSPVRGALTTNNQPLLQTWAWPRDDQGQPLALDQFPRTNGIPTSLYQYLLEHPQADPSGLLRAQGAGGPLPTSGSVPIGMVLDPRTVGYDTLDYRRAAAFERELRAQFTTAFFDLIYDTDPNFTIKNQLFFDRMHQHKNSNQPFVQQQDVEVVEDKLTLTRHVAGTPSWVQLNALMSFNVRDTMSRGASAGADFSSHRTDAMAQTWVDAQGGMTPNTTFASPIDNPDLDADGYPWGTIYRTEFSELGAAMLFDASIAKWKILLGGRIDGSQAENVDYAGSFNPTVGTAQSPGAFTTADNRESAWDSATSWSVSVSYQAPHNVWPYATWSTASIVLDGNNNALTNATIAAGHLGSAEVRELGVKASLLDGRMFATLSAYDQARTDVDADDDPALLYAYATATRTRGIQSELKWVPVRNLLLSSYVLHQETRFDPNVGSVQLVDARTLGFQDVVDANGNVVYPAEAFLYGGRSRIILPDGMQQFAKKQGNPENQAGLSVSWMWKSGLGVAASGNYFSSTCTGRLCVVHLPAAYVVNAAILFDRRTWLVKLDASNLLNQTYFRARTGDTLGNVLAQALPDRRLQLSVRVNF